jgi:hypothetical protein
MMLLDDSTQMASSNGRKRGARAVKTPLYRIPEFHYVLFDRILFDRIQSRRLNNSPKHDVRPARRCMDQIVLCCTSQKHIGGARK